MHISRSENAVQSLHILQYSEGEDLTESNQTSVKHLREAAWAYYNLENVLIVAGEKIKSLHHHEELSSVSFNAIDSAVSSVIGFCKPVNMCLSYLVTIVQKDGLPSLAIPQPPTLNPATSPFGSIIHSLIDFTRATITALLDSTHGDKMVSPLSALKNMLITLVNVIKANHPPLLC